MPKIWLDYAKFAADCQKVTMTIKIFDRALQTLPVTQHKLVWDEYLEWALSVGTGEADPSLRDEK